jgi:SRSO17 transposase
MAEAILGDGVLVLDEPGFAKQSKASVAWRGSYTRTLGQVGNCQISVSCCDMAPQTTRHVAVRWSLPRTWELDALGSRSQNGRVCP